MTESTKFNFFTNYLSFKRLMFTSFTFDVIFHKKRLPRNYARRKITSAMFTVNITRKIK